MLKTCATEKIKRGQLAKNFITSSFSEVKITRHESGSFELNAFVPFLTKKQDHLNIYENIFRKEFPAAIVEVKRQEQILPIILSTRAPSSWRLNFLIDFLVLISFKGHSYARTKYYETHFLVHYLRMFRVIQLFRLAQYGKTATTFLSTIWNMRENFVCL